MDKQNKLMELQRKVTAQTRFGFDFRNQYDSLMPSKSATPKDIQTISNNLILHKTLGSATNSHAQAFKKNIYSKSFKVRESPSKCQSLASVQPYSNLSSAVRKSKSPGPRGAAQKRVHIKSNSIKMPTQNAPNVKNKSIFVPNEQKLPQRKGKSLG